MDLLDRDTFFVGGEGQPLPTRVSAILPTFEVTVTVNRGINLPHRPTETKRHPTYECILEVHTGNGQCSLFKPHVVERFFDQYRRLHQALQTIGIGHQKHHTSIYIEAPFPCTYFLSQFGFRLSEDLLIRR